MAALSLIDFQDIQNAIMEELKIPSTDTTTLNRIKRDINIAYQDLCSRHNFWWLRKRVSIQTSPKIITGTISITNDSDSITFSSAPTASIKNYKLKITGFDEIYEIQSHIAATTTATLRVPFKGTTNATASYIVWKDFVDLPTDLKETELIDHQHFDQPMRPQGLTKFRRIVASNPALEDKPVYYTTDDFNVAGTERQLKFWPAIDKTGVTLDVDYIQAVDDLDLNGDEPLVPLTDRIVLMYGGLKRAWSRERNEQMAIKNEQLYEKKIAEMAKHLEDSSDTPVFKVSSGYLASKRRRRRGNLPNA